MKIIETDNLSKYYGKTRGIENVTLSVDKGDIFGFIGPNGAGKSTTVRTLLGLISPTNGSARALGFDILKDREKILQNIGYLPSETVFYGGMSVLDMLNFSAGLHKKDCRLYAGELCERLGLDVTKKISQLSLGNRKKVGIVCALQHKPSLYILDEPTSSLDPLMQREFFTLLQEASGEGATVFLSSHVLSEIQKHCAHAAIIKNGRILACDSVEKLAGTGTKRVVLQGTNSLPELENIKNPVICQNSAEFLYSGDVNVLISELSKMTLDDVSISEPALEDVFMHYYEKENAEDANNNA